MLNLLQYLFKQGRLTQSKKFPPLNEVNLGLPKIDTNNFCLGSGCMECTRACPTNAINISEISAGSLNVSLDLGFCIGCNLCIEKCPTSLIVRNGNTNTATTDLLSLIISNQKEDQSTKPVVKNKKFPFRKSLSIRVVSTGCSACDLEVGAAGNPVFDMERFGIQIVASPRMADALLVTGPVGSSMKEAVKRTYEAMPNPKIVIAAGSCAISGGIHYDGYAQANGVTSILPVDIFIPGCPPHPWSIIYGIMLAMGQISQ